MTNAIEDPSADASSGPVWFAVRCVFRDTGQIAGASRRRMFANLYEERITLWLANDETHAFSLAEAEALRYAEQCEYEFVRYSNLYRMSNEPQNGAEIYSQMRLSRLGVRRYLNRFIDAGSERQRS